MDVVLVPWSEDDFWLLRRANSPEMTAPLGGPGSRGHRYLHAFPKVGNVASDGVCRRAGFALLGVVDLEYPEGNPITSNDWRVDLGSGGPGPGQ